MVTILLVVLLVIAVAMIGTVLIQRSEGGALGIGGGQGGGLMSARGSANLLSRATAVLAFLFIAVCLILAVLTGGERKATSVVEGEAAPPAAAGEAGPNGPVLPESAGELLVIPDREPAQMPIEETPSEPVIPDAGDEFLVIPDDSTESWDPGALESPALPATPGADGTPVLPDVDLPPVPEASDYAPAGAAPEPPNPLDSGDQPATPLLPSAY